MKTSLILLMLVAPACFSSVTLDLTKPENLDIADIYPSFQMLRSLSFEDTKDNVAYFGFKTKKDNEDWDTIFSAKISSNTSGEQSIYIVLSKGCTSSDEAYERIIIRTNEQNVRYDKFCNGTNIYITPASKAGDNFLIGEFKKKDAVSFDFSDISIVFEAAGFTESWSNYGGDAL
jgi:hypothetical protein